MVIALGYTILRNELEIREKQIALISFTLYLGVGILKATCIDGVSSCGTYNLIDYVLRSLIMLATIVALNYNLSALTAGIMGVNWMSSTQASYRAIIMFYSFRWTYLGYLLLPTFGLIINIALLSWEHEWAIHATTEVILCALYVRFLIAFLPADTRPYNALLRIAETIERGIPLSDERSRIADSSRAALQPRTDRNEIDNADVTHRVVHNDTIRNRRSVMLPDVSSAQVELTRINGVNGHVEVCVN